MEGFFSEGLIFYFSGNSTSGISTGNSSLPSTNCLGVPRVPGEANIFNILNVKLCASRTDSPFWPFIGMGRCLEQILHRISDRNSMQNPSWIYGPNGLFEKSPFGGQN